MGAWLGRTERASQRRLKAEGFKVALFLAAVAVLWYFLDDWRALLFAFLFYMWWDINERIERGTDRIITVLAKMRGEED